jgi:carboxypeptidase PM20D1
VQGRTTAAVTGLQGYVGDNVLPPSVTVNVNFRLLPGDTVQDVMSYLQGVVGPE